jgi:hypothetical protein
MLLLHHLVATALLALQGPLVQPQHRVRRAPEARAIALDPGSKSARQTGVYHVAGEISSHHGHHSVKLPELDEEDKALLDSGEMMMKFHAVGKSGNEGIAAQLVNAPADHIWQSLLDWGEWPRMVDDVVAADVYESNELGHVKVKVTLGVGPLRIRTHVHHIIDRDAQTMTWQLDPTKRSDLQANRGFWMVQPQSPTSSIVYYSVSVTLHKWTPGWLDRYIAREGFPRALGWVKREAEDRFGSDLA